MLWSGISSAQLHDTLRIVRDSLRKGITRRVDSVSKKAWSEVDMKKKQLTGQFSQSDIGKLFATDSLKKQSGFGLKDFSVENSAQYIKTLDPSSGRSFLNNVTINGQLTIFGMPVDLSVANNYNALRSFNPQQGNLFRFNVPKPGFDQLFGAELSRYKSLRSTILQNKNLESLLRSKIQSRLSTIAHDKLSGSPKLASLLNNPDALHKLISMDEKQLRSRLDEAFADLKQHVNSKSDAIQQTATDSLKKIVIAEQEKLVKEITSIKKELNANGLDEAKLMVFQKILENRISKKELETFAMEELSRNPNLNWLQRSYSQLGEFQAGNFGSVLPGNSLNRDLFLNGFNVSFKTARGPVRAGLSSNKDIQASKDIGFETSTFSLPKLYTYLSVPTTNFSFGSGKLSWVGAYDRQFSGSMATALNALPRNNLVFTLSQALNLKQGGMLNLDVSKSSTQYKNLASLGPDQLMLDRNTNGNYFRDDFLETMSLGMNHSLDAKRMGLKSSVYINYSGVGFQNPGQQGIGNLNLRFGGNIRKNMFHNRWSLALRSDFKNMPISALDHAHWKNYQVQVDSRIKLFRASSLNIKYMENGVEKVAETVTPVYGSRKVQVDLNSSYKVMGINSFSHIGMGRQEMRNPLSQGNTNLAQLNYLQTMVFKGFSLNASLFYNRELSQTTILGNMLNSDLGIQYQIFGTVSMSTGLSYLDNQSLARQAGVKQSIQFMLRKHFDVSGYLDLRRNMITPLYPDLFSTSRAELSIHYYLDKP
ncbi:hypothetical protein DU508_16510 [Pedobacter chinensis]|uniref:Uncharacterized protein n=2 Tax=Pedobacter chinensis TaxID=2282421 RepID=A0A369PT78_9SPHI|nr:hypothetical protein DU508_16510 [Pedobacter chinensis]